MNSSGGTPQIQISEIKTKLNELFTEEFNDSFQDILNISHNDFITQFIHRLNILLLSYHRSLIPILRNHHEIFNEAYKIIHENFYLPAKIECERTMSNPVKEKLKNFRPHCINNTTPLHTCQGSFFVVRDQVSKSSRYVICSNCKCVYNIDCILMYCQSCDTDFFSCYDESVNSLCPPATWDQYHCGIMYNQQMSCLKCKSLLWLKGKRLFCKKCNKDFIPNEVEWVCILCKKKFKSGAKVYNPLEFRAMKISVKRAIVNKMLIKPTILPCRCDLNPLKLSFKHNNRCCGVLYEGDIFGKKMVVCSECKIFSMVTKFNWFCPICKKTFKSNYTRTFPSNSKNYKDEFTIQNDESLSSISTNYSMTKEKQINRVIIPTKLKETVKKEVENLSVSRCITSEQDDIAFIKHKKNYIQNTMIYKRKISSKGYSNISGNNDNCLDVSGLNQQNGKFSLASVKNTQEIQLNHIRVLSNPNIIESKNNKEDNRNSSKESKIYRKTSVGHLAVVKSSQKSISNALYNSNVLMNSFISEFTCDEDNHHDLFFNVEDYNVITQLGQGTYGKIYLVQDKDKQIFCLKKMILNDSKSVKSIRSEYDIFSKYQHINILKILGFSEKKIDMTSYAFYILMEVGKTDWEKEITQRQTNATYYSERELINILKQLTKALSYLQRNKIAHRDVKAQNVLVFERGIYKLADFGEAKKYNCEVSLLNSIRGTEMYMSPLLFNGLQKRAFEVKHNVFKSDVFSLGMCLLYAVTLNIKILCRVREYNDLKRYKHFLLNLIKGRYSNSFSELLCKMLSLYETERPDFIELEEILETF